MKSRPGAASRPRTKAASSWPAPTRSSLARGRRTDQLDRDRLPLKPSEDRIQPFAQPRAGTQAERLPRRSGRGRPRPLDAGEYRAGFRQEPLARFREPDRPRRPVEQQYPELAFQPGDLLAHRGLADLQLIGGAAEVEDLSHRHEVLDLPQLHPEMLPEPGMRSPAWGLLKPEESSLGS
jgi:hypothetical protein